MFMLRNVNVDFGTESSMGIRGVVHAAQIFPLVDMKSAEWKKSDVIFCHSSAADFTLGRPDADPSLNPRISPLISAADPQWIFQMEKCIV